MYVMYSDIEKKSLYKLHKDFQISESLQQNET